MINGIYAATLSVLDQNLALNVGKTIKYAENLIDKGCHGVVFFGSTGQSQLVSIGEKIQLINSLPKSKHSDNFIIGTGLNSLADNINLMKIAKSNGLNRFLIMPPAYYKYEDKDVINFYSRLIDEIKNCEIILYNFEKLSGYKFSKECVETLVKNFPQQIIGVKDSSYNLFENLKIKNFSVMPGSELKLLKGLELGCSGIITATTNVTSILARDVFDKYQSNSTQISNEKLCSVRSVFDEYNLISGLHTFMSQIDNDFSNLLPPLKLLNASEKKDFFMKLEQLEFDLKHLPAA